MKYVETDASDVMMDMPHSQNAVGISERCHALSCVCVFLVILVHTLRIPQKWMSSTDMCGIDYATALLNFGVCANLGRLAVPMFFVMSGFWLVRSYNSTVVWWWNAVRKRVKTILIPMVEWVALALLYECLGEGVRLPSSYNGFLPPEVQQFWYYRTLFIFVCLSPLAIWILRKRKMGLMLIAVIWLFAFVGMPGQHQYAMWIDQAAFLSGIWLGFHRVDIKLPTKWIVGATVCFMAFATAFGCLHKPIFYTRAMYLVIPFGCVSLWLLSGIVVRVMRPLCGLYSLSVFIFGIYFVVLWNIRDLLDSFGLKFQSVSYMCIQYFLTILICIVSGLMMKMVFPKVLKGLSGGRG